MGGRRSAGVVAALLLGGSGLVTGATSATAAGGTDTSFTYSSQSGDYVGQGRSGTLSDPSTFRISGTAGFVTVGIDTGTEWWTVDLAAPEGRQLTPGTYENVTRAGFNTTYGGLDVSSTGRGCNATKGRFTVYAISSDTLGRVTSLDATFTQFCDASAGGLTGTVHYAAPAAGPVVLTSSDPASVVDQPVTLAARVLPGTGAVTFRDGGTVLGQATPDAAAVARLTTTRLSVGTHALTATQGTSTTSAVVSQVVAPGGTSLWFQSAFRDYIGQGATESFVPATSTIGVQGGASYLTFSVDTADQWWDVVLAAPPGRSLTPGTYTGAVRAAFRGAGQPGLDVGGTGRGCNTVAGSFTVDRISTDAAGAVSVLDASFTQYCEGGPVPLTGRVRWNADAPVPVTSTTSLSAPRSAKVGRATGVGVGVAGAGTTAPTGSVQLYDGTAAVGSPVPVSGGRATISWTPTAKGQHTLVVRYSGDTHYEPSTSAASVVKVT